MGQRLVVAWVATPDLHPFKEDRFFMQHWHRRRWLGALAGALVGTAVLTACSGIRSGPRQVDISEARLLAMVAQQFPLQ